MIEFEIPVRVMSEANLREHWAKKHKRSRSQRIHTHYAWTQMLGTRHHVKPKPPCIVTLIRIAPRNLDTDNLARGFKAIRDQIADELGVDDGDPIVEWRYDQMRRGRREYAVIVRIEECQRVVDTENEEV